MAPASERLRWRSDMRSIVAVTNDYGIGLEGKLLTHISADLKRFKEITLGGVVIYGRKTLETYPKKKALPGRVNIMLTRNKSIEEPNIETVDSIDVLLTKIDLLRRQGVAEDDLFVIGGAEIYRQLHPYVHEVLITRMDAAFEADTFFPNLDLDPDFERVDVSPWHQEEGVRFRYETWRRQLSDLTLKKTLKRDRLALSRTNVGDFSHETTIKARQARLDNWVKEPGRTIYALEAGEKTCGFLLYAQDVLAFDTALAILHSDVSLSQDALVSIFESLFADNEAHFSLLLAAEARVLPKLEGLSDFSTLALPSITSTKTLVLGTRFDLARGAVGFYPFKFGLVAMKSDGEALTEVAFLRHGQVIDDPSFTMALGRQGSLTKNRRLKENIAAPFTSTKREDKALKEAFDWLDAYFAKRKDLPARPALSNRVLPPFMTRVLHALSDIPYGEHLTYSELAEILVGPEKANHYARAVGQACAANPYALFIPCHRVIGNKGELVGFAGGVQIKDYLLNLELVTRLSTSDNTSE